MAGARKRRPPLLRSELPSHHQVLLDYLESEGGWSGTRIPKPYSFSWHVLVCDLVKSHQDALVREMALNAWKDTYLVRGVVSIDLMRALAPDPFYPDWIKENTQLHRAMARRMGIMFAQDYGSPGQYPPVQMMVTALQERLQEFNQEEDERRSESNLQRTFTKFKAWAEQYTTQTTKETDKIIKVMYLLDLVVYDLFWVRSDVYGLRRVVLNYNMGTYNRAPTNKAIVESSLMGRGVEEWPSRFYTTGGPKWRRWLPVRSQD